MQTLDKAPQLVIFGASSGMAVAIAQIYASRAYKIFLVARDQQKLADLEQDLRTRGAADVQTLRAELGTSVDAVAACNEMLLRLPRIDVALLATGLLGDQEQLFTDPVACEQLLNVNINAPIAIGNALAACFIKQQQGVIAFFSSVAGDRGRASNFIYGASKAALTAYCSGLRARLSQDQVHVLTIKPGMIATAMTEHLARSPLMASPQLAAQNIVQAIDKRRDVVYTPAYWLWIMLIIKHLPEFIFKKLKF